VPNLTLLIVLGVQLSITIWALARGRSLQVLPSMVWVFMMVVPFIVTSKYFSSESAIKQSWGILIFSMAFQASDYFAVRTAAVTKISGQIKEIFSLRLLFWISVGISLLIPACHYILSKQIPLIDQVFSEKTFKQISVERENYSKLSQIPSIFKILPNYLFAVFAPFAIVVLLWIRKKPVAVFLIIWTVFYALSSSADFPVLVLIGTIFICALPLLNSSQKRLVTFASIFFLTVTTLSGLILLNRVNQSSLPCVVNGIHVSTPGDKIRTCRKDNVIWVNPVVDRIGYRVFLTPIEVSNNWYRYFGSENNNKREITSVFDRQLSKSAANEVGQWAFVRKFPEEYLKSNASYASIDADAFSFGSIYMILVPFLIFLTRILPIVRSRKIILNGNLFEGFIIAQLCIFPFLASFQAILFTQGLGFLIVVILLSSRTENLNSK